MKLSITEEQLMQYLWKQEKAFMKDLLKSYPEPKPGKTTVATLLKRMTNKGFVAYKLNGSLREYYPVIKKKDYFSKHVNGLIKRFFDNSPSRFVSFFTQETSFDKTQLEDLKAIIERELKKK